MTPHAKYKYDSFGTTLTQFSVRMLILWGRGCNMIEGKLMRLGWGLTGSLIDWLSKKGSKWWKSLSHAGKGGGSRVLYMWHTFSLYTNISNKLGNFTIVHCQFVVVLYGCVEIYININLFLK